ncbi:MAG: hypothetical protein ACKV0T_26180 [Planctomycetales bacterium]
MPVKVRCPSCDKALNAPDAARGKAIKCPGCDTKIRVPGGDGKTTASGGSASSSATRKTTTKSAATRKESPPGSDSAEFMKVDLTKVEDSNVALCSKCGAEIPEDAGECPQCGVDPATGRISAKAAKRAARKGGDPDKFFKIAWGDAWDFTKQNMPTAVRAAILYFVSALLFLFSVFMVGWCNDMPPRVFWGAFGMVCYLVTPGLNWCLIVETIKLTVKHKTDLRAGEIDLFSAVALGIKTLLWSVVFLTPLTFPMYPIAMIHMAMPVTRKGWMFWAILPIFFRHIKPALYWWLGLILSNLLILIIWIVTMLVAGATLWGIIVTFQAGESQTAGKVLLWGILIAYILLGILTCSYVAATWIFNGRVLGQLAYYYRETLDLEVLVAEKQYVAKVIKRDKFGNPIKTPGQKAAQIIVPIVVLLIVIAVGIYVWYRLTHK